MQLSPAFDDFERALRGGANQAVWARLAADMDTPVSLMLKLTDAAQNSFLLESVTGGEIRGRYSVIGSDPDLIWRCRGHAAEINREAATRDDAFVTEPVPTLDSLRALIAESRIDLPHALPPMAAGLFGYLGYDMIRLVERLPEPNPDPLGLPDAMLLRPRLVAIVDNVQGTVTLVAPAWHDARLDPQTAYEHAADRLKAALAAIDRTEHYATPVTPVTAEAVRALDPVSNTTHGEYLNMVERAKEYIRAGDIFQVVPSQRWAMPLEVEPFALYRAVRRINPSPYLFYFNLATGSPEFGGGGFQIVGASPEILVRVRDRIVTIRPIAGTRPRGKTPEEDKALEDDLLADPKERAEHLMLLDLGRNDVGRVAKIGTVDPNEQFTIERYSHVIHIVSNVDGALSDDHDALSALLAGLPAGTVSGAPKIRAMEIIDELEKEKRGVYAGAVGYFSAAGEMDTCIALRTGVVKDGVFYVQAGGGVVYDSDPEAEYQETVSKSKALMHAAAVARDFN